MVERNLAKVEVASSSLVSRSKSEIREAPASLFRQSIWLDSKAVMHRIANPCRSVRLRLEPPPFKATELLRWLFLFLNSIVLHTHARFRLLYADGLQVRQGCYLKRAIYLRP